MFAFLRKIFFWLFLLRTLGFHVVCWEGWGGGTEENRHGPHTTRSFMILPLEMLKKLRRSICMRLQLQTGECSVDARHPPSPFKSFSRRA